MSKHKKPSHLTPAPPPGALTVQDILDTMAPPKPPLFDPSHVQRLVQERLVTAGWEPLPVALKTSSEVAPGQYALSFEAPPMPKPVWALVQCGTMFGAPTVRLLDVKVDSDACPYFAKLGYAKAMEAVLAGGRASRRANPSAWVFADPGVEFEVAEGRAIAKWLATGTKVRDAPGLRICDGSTVAPYTPSDADVAAEDWVVL